MTVTVPTSEAQYGYVVGRVIRALGDTTDADDKPDAVAAVGSVSFTPKAPLGRTTDYSAFIVREKITAPLDAAGNLVRYEGATPAGITLTVGAYRVDFTLNSGTIPGFDIEVTAAHTQAAPLDLVTAAPYVPPSGVTVNAMLVPAGAVVGQVLGWSESGLDWVDMAAGGGGAVSSVAGRTGDVVLSSADLTDAASLATDAELTSGLAGKANSSHTHAPADITGTAVITTDPRLSDARTPTAHTHPASAINDSTATGRSLVTAADAAAARTAIGAGTSNLAIGTTGTTAAAGNRQATETAIGMVELATTAEATAGADTVRAVTPAGLKAVADTKANATHSHSSAQVTDFTEATQDVVGAMVTGAGGTYDDAAGTITLPSGGGGGLPAYGGRAYARLLPGHLAISRDVAFNMAADRAYFIPFFTQRPWTPAEIGIRVASAGAGSLYIWIYAAAAANESEGTGSAVLDVTNGTGVNVSTAGDKWVTGLSTTLQPGAYVAALRSSAAVILSAFGYATEDVLGNQYGWTANTTGITATTAPLASALFPANQGYGGTNAIQADPLFWRK